jgi:uncharacterized membrane protein YhaH (DUF805 family)
MTPVDWAKRPIQKYADFSGRAPRAEYWWYTLAVIVLAIVISIIESTLGLPRLYLTYGPLSLLLMLALIVPGLAVTVRRLHDTERSGWWILVALVPYAVMMVAAGGAVASGSMGALAGAGLLTIVALCGAIALLVFIIIPGTAGDNRYGPNPYGIATPAE